MKNKCTIGATALLLALLTSTVAGCFSCTSPYDYVENWLIREDPVRTFVIPADLIYVQGDMYTKLANVHMMQDYARMEVGMKKFSGLARVFSPLIASSDDLEEALNWYFRYHHRKGRPFIFIGEGEGGRLLKEYERNDAEDLKEMGLVASYYTDTYRKGFVTSQMVEEIRRAVARARFKAIWGKDMPEGMLSD